MHSPHISHEGFPAVPQDGLELMNAIEGTRGAVPVGVLPACRSLVLDAAAGRGIDRMTQGSVTQELMAVVAAGNMPEDVHAINRVTVFGKDGRHSTVLTVTAVGDSHQATETKGFVAPEFGPIELGQDITVEQSPVQKEKFLLMNSGQQPVRIAYGNGRHFTGEGGYFGICWADTRQDDEGNGAFEVMSEAGLLPGQENYSYLRAHMNGETLQEEAAQPERSETATAFEIEAAGRLALQASSESPFEPGEQTEALLQGEDLVRHADGRWSKYGTDPEDVEQWRVEEEETTQRWRAKVEAENRKLRERLKDPLAFVPQGYQGRHRKGKHHKASTEDVVEVTPSEVFSSGSHRAPSANDILEKWGLVDQVESTY